MHDATVRDPVPADAPTPPARSGPTSPARDRSGTTSPASIRSDGGRRPAMSDVAARAGVSHQTVSRVLNGHPAVRPQTRDRVLAAITELGYRRNSAARALATSRTSTIGVVTVNSMLFGPSQMLLGIERAAREAGYWLSLASLDQVDGARMAGALSHFRDQGVEGIAVIAPNDSAVRAAQESAGGTPTVLVTAASAAETHLPVVHIDQRAGTRLAVEHLLSLGHRDIAHLGGPMDWFEARTRRDTWAATLREAGLAVREVLPGRWDPADGFHAGMALLAAGDLPTAVFSSNDQMAMGLLRALAEHGVKVPRDVSVVGFDDEPDSGFLLPPLTTVRQDFGRLGRECIRMLLALLAGQEPTPEPITPRLVLRSSTGPVREPA